MKKSVHTEAYAQLRKLLVEARRESGLTQTQVAKSLSVPQSFVSKYEKGERRLDVIEFLQIAKILNCDASAILKELDLR